MKSIYYIMFYASLGLIAATTGWGQTKTIKEERAKYEQALKDNIQLKNEKSSLEQQVKILQGQVATLSSRPAVPLLTPAEIANLENAARSLLPALTGVVGAPTAVNDISDAEKVFSMIKQEVADTKTSLDDIINDIQSSNAAGSKISFGDAQLEIKKVKSDFSNLKKTVGVATWSDVSTQLQGFQNQLGAILTQVGATDITDAKQKIDDVDNQLNGLLTKTAQGSFLDAQRAISLVSTDLNNLLLKTDNATDLPLAQARIANATKDMQSLIADSGTSNFSSAFKATENAKTTAQALKQALGATTMSGVIYQIQEMKEALDSTNTNGIAYRKNQLDDAVAALELQRDTLEAFIKGESNRPFGEYANAYLKAYYSDPNNKAFPIQEYLYPYLDLLYSETPRLYPTVNNFSDILNLLIQAIVGKKNTDGTIKAGVIQQWMFEKQNQATKS